MRDQPRSLGAHLEELRGRLIWSALAIVAGAVLAGVFHEEVIGALIRPAREYLSVTNKPIFTEVTEFLGVVVRIAVLGGLVVALPVLAYQVVLFVAPALNPAERRLALAFVPTATLLFSGGVAFAYFILLPPALRFLLTFGQEIATPMIRISGYVSLVVTLVFWIGVVFETPLLMFLLAKLGVVSYRGFARARRYLFVGAFVAGAVITPTFDPLNQTLVALPLIVLYEVGIFVAWLVRPRERQATRTARPAEG
ncbi:MAG: twin-arginine translocase subunit TatC [SAR202 cluster bacterium]|nr:twin-arginine translocase subunit TatC [SAR202 cluster bacterium]